LVRDPGGLSSSIRTVTISITGTNDPPVAVNNTITGVTEDFLYCGAITGYSDIDNVPTITTGIFTTVGLGVVTINGDGSFCLNPEPNVNGGPKLIPFEVCDSFACVTANLIFNIIEVNDSPVVTNLTLAGGSGSLLTSSLTLFQSNATVPGSIYDIDNAQLDLLGLVLTSTGNLIGITTSNQSVTINGTGLVNYFSSETFTGIDTFVLNVGDGLFTTTGTIFFIVSPSNALPIPQNDSKAGFENETITGNVLTNDLNPLSGSSSGLTVSGVGISNIGTLAINSLTGEYSFIPTVNLPSGVRSITSISMDICNKNGCAASILTITINGVNDPPIAIDQFNTIIQNGILTGTITGFSDIDNATNELSVSTLVGGLPKKGAITINADGSYVYIPSIGEIGIDSVRFQVCDNGTPQLCANAILVITIIPESITTISSGLPSSPTILGTNTAGFEDTTKTIILKDFVLANPNDSISFAITAGPFHGSVTGFDTKNGSFMYENKLNYNGKDTVYYEVCATRNNVTSCTSGFVIINIAPVNDPPLAVADMMVLEKGQTVALGNALTNDSDIDGDTIKAMVQSNAKTIKGGLFAIDEKGHFTYSKPDNFSGIDSAMYLIKDPSGASDTAYIVFVIPASQFVSEGFSPNGDKSNDTWFVKLPEGSTKISVIVYNRWGNKVFEADDYKNDWDGISNQGLRVGEGLPDGTYFYIIDFHDGNKPIVNYLTLSR